MGLWKSSSIFIAAWLWLIKWPYLVHYGPGDHDWVTMAASHGCLLHLVAVFMTHRNLWDGGYCALSPMGSQCRANTAHLHHEKITPRVSRLNNVLIKSRRIIKSGEEAKYFELFPGPHSCLIVSDKSGNGECDIVKYFHSISVKYFPPQAENIFRDSQ